MPEIAQFPGDAVADKGSNTPARRLPAHVFANGRRAVDSTKDSIASVHMGKSKRKKKTDVVAMSQKPDLPSRKWYQEYAGEIFGGLCVAALLTAWGTSSIEMEERDDAAVAATEAVRDAITSDGFTESDWKEFAYSMKWTSEDIRDNKPDEIAFALQVGRCSLPDVYVTIVKSANGSLDATEYSVPASPVSDTKVRLTGITNVSELQKLTAYQDCFTK